MAKTFEELLKQHWTWSEDEKRAASMAWLWRDAEVADAKQQGAESANLLRFILMKEKEGYVGFCGMPWRRKIETFLATLDAEPPAAPDKESEK